MSVIKKLRLICCAITCLPTMFAAPTAAATSSLWCKVNPAEKEAVGVVDLPLTSLRKVKDQYHAAGVIGKASYKAITWRVASSLLGEGLGRKGTFILARYTQPKWIGGRELTNAEAGVAYSAPSRTLYLYTFSLTGRDDAFENIIVLIDIDKPVTNISVACLSAT